MCNILVVRVKYLKTKIEKLQQKNTSFLEGKAGTDNVNAEFKENYII